MQQSTYSKTGEKNFLDFFKLVNLHATIYIYLYCTKIERIKSKIMNQYFDSLQHQFVYSLFISVSKSKSSSIASSKVITASKVSSPSDEFCSVYPLVIIWIYFIYPLFIPCLFFVYPLFISVWKSSSVPSFSVIATSNVSGGSPLFTLCYSLFIICLPFVYHLFVLYLFSVSKSSSIASSSVIAASKVSFPSDGPPLFTLC